MHHPTSTSRVHYDVDSAHPHPERQPRVGSVHSTHSEPDVSHIPPAPIVKRRGTRSATFQTVNENPERINWHAGQEPGLDPSKRNGGRSQMPILHAECQITIVDLGENDMYMQDLNNKELISFLEKKQEDWVKCRWINVNGLSWDVIQALGKYKKLHRLALEDLVNTNNRTKADWYSDHTFVVLPLAKLVTLPPNESDSESDDDSVKNWANGVEEDTGARRKRGRFAKVLRDLGISKKGQSNGKNASRTNSFTAGLNQPTDRSLEPNSSTPVKAGVDKIRTLQGYHPGTNRDRMDFMEAHSLLTEKGLAVSAEQVSIFLTADNTVISFFESSADDIEQPILARLSTPDTILRRSCDASMIVQAIIDAIIDLAIPVTHTYQDVIGELEVDVLTQPSIKHVTSLYIIITEITAMRNLILPIVNLIGSLRDHKTIAADSSSNETQRSVSTVVISPTARTYFADVEDHCLLMSQSLDQMRRSADGMIDLIFNTISAFQNESMKQLTTVTIIFLPLTFITGYFGMNFHTFPSLDHGEPFFWSIAIPVAVGTTILMMRNWIWRWGVKKVQRRGISRNRKKRLAREERSRRND